jgi:hypothetical protein
MQLRKIGALFAIALILFTFCVCSKHSSQLQDIDSMVNKLAVPDNTILAITNGSSLEAIRNALGSAARHEFTIRTTNGEYTLISCLVFAGDGVNFWLLFHNTRLAKIIWPLSPEMETYPYRGTTASRIKSWNIEDTDKIKKTIGSSGLTDDQIQVLLDDTRRADQTAGKSGNIPSAVLSGFDQLMAPRMKDDYTLNQQLRNQYDGCRVNLGMDVQEVEKLFGKPLRVFHTESGKTVRVYGDSRDLQVNPAYVFSCIAVVFDAHEAVASIYSHEFFNDDWKRAGGNQ